MTAAERELREAAAEAAEEVLWHLERGDEPPPHMLAKAEDLLRAIGALPHEGAPVAGMPSTRTRTPRSR